MKILPLILTLASCITLNAQVLNLTNATTNIENEQFALTTAAVTEGERARALVQLDYNATDIFYLRGEAQMGTDTSFVENLGVGFGFTTTIKGFRLFAGPMIRYSWTAKEAQGLIGAGTAYQPFKDGALAPWSIYAEARLVTPFNNRIRSEPPHRELCAGIRYSFRGFFK